MTGNEFGVIAAHTNTMIEGLKHRIALMGDMKVAEEVQKSLLPQAPPRIEGVDAAARSLPSDQTGGDYFDFFRLPGGNWVVAVGDVSGHGVGAALLMTSVRAFLRMAADQTSDLARIVGRVNTQLARDVGESGSFLTLFLLEIDPENRILSWINGGHDPALLYDPVEDGFVELGGSGPALGLFDEFAYRVGTHRGWSPGSLLVIGTDGIWEAHNESRAMFGKERFKKILRSRNGQPPPAILSAVMSDLHEFRGRARQEDDETLVVIKFETKG